jgi:hypothetical protein
VRSTKELIAASTFSRVEGNATANDAADEIVELVQRMDYYMITDAQRAYLKRAAGAALANRFVFACLDDNPDHDNAAWVFTPVDAWAVAGQVNTIPAPLEDHLPSGAQEISDGVWMWQDGKNKVDRAMALLAEGFIWDPDFQTLIDRSQTGLLATMQRLHAPRPPRPLGPPPAP